MNMLESSQCNVLWAQKTVGKGRGAESISLILFQRTAIWPFFSATQYWGLYYNHMEQAEDRWQNKYIFYGQ